MMAAALATASISVALRCCWASRLNARITAGTQS
jgi:hypothetical protein